MRTCFACEAEMPNDAEFCHKCGVPVTSQAARAKPPRKPRPAPSAEQLAKSRAEHVAIQGRILAAVNSKTNKAIVFLVVSFALLAVSVLVYDGKLNIGHFGAFFLIITIAANSMGRYRGMTQGEYYSISGSRSADGKHRCIFCGNPGIYTQGEYAGNTKYAQCSKCREPLFFH